MIFDYAKKITRSEWIFFIKKGSQDNAVSFTTDWTQHENENGIKAGLMESIGCIESLESPEYLRVGDMLFLAVPVKCHFRTYGVIGAAIMPGSNDQETGEIIYQLTFLSELGTIALEKFELEHINRRLLINEEQNRIANEIHDGVLQKLFSLSCGIYAMMNRPGKLSRMKIQSELSMMQASINHIMGELRSTIYGYSWKKDGVNNFVLAITSYIQSIKRQHGNDVSFVLKGNHELLSTDQKKAFYRIVCEGIGNAIRHGKAEHIKVELSVGVKDILLKISDDGTGFDIRMMEENGKPGMGLGNMQLLAQSLRGELQLISELNNGTTITITVPVQKAYKEAVV